MKMIGHRGYPKYELENTKESFLAAANRNFFGIETDITFIKNHKMVLFHDEDLMRLANDPRKIREMTYEEVMDVKLNAKGTYHTTDYHVAIPLEYLRICKHYNKFAVVEIKPGAMDSEIDEVMHMIINEDMYENSCVISFTYDIVKYIKNKYPNYPVQHLIGMAYSEELINDCIQNGISIDIRHDLVTKELVERFHQVNLEVNCWTVDKIEDIKRVTECNVDYITTNMFDTGE